MKRPSERTIEALVASQFPALGAVRATPLGEGYDNWAFDVNATWVFRFPQREEVERQIAAESALLAALAPHSPIPLPTNELRGRPSAEFPREFVGYPKLPGHPAISIDPNDDHWSGIAETIGTFLGWLHSSSVDEARRFGLVDYRIADTIEELQAESLEDLELVARHFPDAPVNGWRAFLEAGVDTTTEAGPPVVVHTDLAGEHVLVDPSRGQVTGVIDWSDAAVCDRSIDLAGLFHWGGPVFVDRVLAHYRGPVDEVTLARARFFAVHRGVGDIVFGVRRNRPEYVSAGLRALRWFVSPL